MCYTRVNINTLGSEFLCAGGGTLSGGKVLCVSEMVTESVHKPTCSNLRGVWVGVPRGSFENGSVSI